MECRRDFLRGGYAREPDRACCRGVCDERLQQEEFALSGAGRARAFGEGRAAGRFAAYGDAINPAERTAGNVLSAVALVATPGVRAK
jgi:hypothetical protein